MTLKIIPSDLFLTTKIKTMIKVLIILSFFTFVITLQVTAQNATGIVCTDITINDQSRDVGSEFRRSLESVLSSLKNPPIIIERKKIQELIEKVQEELNLNKDLNTNEIQKLRAAQVDYVMYGNFVRRLTNVNYDLQLECIKISGINAFSKISFPILSFTEEELTNTDMFRKKLFEMLNNYSFSSDFGIIQNDLLFKINHRLDEKDAQIRQLDSAYQILKMNGQQQTSAMNNISTITNKLEDEISQKDQEIRDLNSEISGVKDFSHIATLNLFGLDQMYGFGLTGWKTELYNLMFSVVIKKENGYQFKYDDSSISILSTIIEKYPKFPFGYYGMSYALLRRKDPAWKEFAKKALSILIITTSIDGHKPEHDQTFEALNQWLKLEKEGHVIKLVEDN